MNWSILGIEPTKDKKVITNAYRQKLRQTNPEDKPEEFKALRGAYEEALVLADQQGCEQEKDESPVGLWMEEVVKLYEDYASRIDPKCWQELLNRDVCIGLDTRPAAEEALLRFFMENYYLPKCVWKVLDETFRFSERAQELYETWPQDFIDNAVLAGIRFEASLDYRLFSPGVSGKDCDEYRRLYFQAIRLPWDEAEPILEQMDALSESHPYGEILRYRIYIEGGRVQEGKEGLVSLTEQYPDNVEILMPWVYVCMDEGNISEVERKVAHILEMEPDHVGARVCHARCLAAKNEYHEARECICEVMRENAEDPMLMEELAPLLTEWNEKLIIQYQEIYQQDPDNGENAIELAWCYLQNEWEEEAVEVAEKVDPNSVDAFSYHNLMGKLYQSVERYEEALEHMERLEDVLRNMTEDGTEKTRKRMARLPEMLQIQGICLMHLERIEEAKEKLEQALAEAPENTEVLSLMGRVLFMMGDYPYAVEIFQRVLRLSNDARFARLLLPMSLYYMGRDREAFDAVNQSIAIHGNDLSLYILKMQILVRNGAYEDVHEMLEFLEEKGAPEDIAVDFIKTELMEMEQGLVENARIEYTMLKVRMEKGEDMLLGPELYYHLAVLTGNQLDMTEKENCQKVLVIIDKGLALKEHDKDLLAYKAWVMKKGGMQEEAIAMYKEMERKNPESEVALRGLADLYYDNLGLHAADALDYYEKLLENQKSAELYFYAGTCKRYLGDPQGAEVYYRRELEMEPEDIDGYIGLAIICNAKSEYDKSLEILDQALEIMNQSGQFYESVVEHKVKVLRRLERFEEALILVAEAAKRYDYAGAWSLQFAICCQAGMWDRAKLVLDRWKEKTPNDPEVMVAGGRLNLLQGKIFKAIVAMAQAKHKITDDQLLSFRLQLNDLEGDHKRMVHLWNRRLSQNPHDNHTLTSMAFVHWCMGMEGTARMLAERAMTELDAVLAENLIDEPLYRGRRGLMLAILGKGEEAKAELARTRKLPLCEWCEYGRCKDADIYEAAIEEILGNYAEAKKLYEAGQKKWPDELDFVAGQRRLKKKGRKINADRN